MITRFDGVQLTPEDAEYVAGALELLVERLGAGAAEKLKHVTAQIRKTVDAIRVSPSDASADATNQRPQQDWVHDADYATVTPEEAARLLGCTADNVRGLVRRGRLPARRVGPQGGRIAVDAAAVAARAERHKFARWE